MWTELRGCPGVGGARSFGAGAGERRKPRTWACAGPGAAQNAAELNVDANCISVGGDSAGGNLAAVVALMARDRGGPKLDKQVLVYPVTDYFSHGVETPYESYRSNATGYMLTSQAMDDFWALYLAKPEDGANPYASPIRASDLSGLPPAYVAIAEHDPLRDEGRAYADRLRAAGVPVTVDSGTGLIHGYLRALTWSAAVRASFARMCDWL